MGIASLNKKAIELIFNGIDKIDRDIVDNAYDLLMHDSLENRYATMYFLRHHFVDYYRIFADYVKGNVDSNFFTDILNLDDASRENIGNIVNSEIKNATYYKHYSILIINGSGHINPYRTLWRLIKISPKFYFEHPIRTLSALVTKQIPLEATKCTIDNETLSEDGYIYCRTNTIKGKLLLDRSYWVNPASYEREEF